MKRNKGKRRLAAWLAVITFCMSVITYLPPDLLTAWGFGLVFVSSGQPGHPYLKGRVEGEPDQTWFLCMNKGASAKSSYDYSKVNMDVSYSEGTLTDKRMFWAYIGAFGSSDKASFPRDMINRYEGSVTKDQAKEVSWSKGTDNGGSDFVETMANDGFMSLENLPPGCKSPNDIFDSISQYGEPEKAMWMGKIQKGPGEIDLEKLYDIAGMSDLSSFLKYCKITSADPTEKIAITELPNNGLWIERVDDNGYPLLQQGPLTIKVEYDPTIFKVVKVEGTLEFFKCNEKDSQQLYRAKGTMEVVNPEFYITSQSLPPEIPPGTPTDRITVDIYEHLETFESNYKVDLTKKDYETGNPLKGSTWEVLEKFDDSQLSGDEENGGITRDNMREAPTTWPEWMIFNDDMVTDEKGKISHADQRFYDFSRKYCDGHPIPTPPDVTGDEGIEGGADDSGDAMQELYDLLMTQWQDAVDECVAVAADSNGTFYHWECGSETKPTEEEAFEASGCKADRDTAYQNFINLEYSYTFRETDAADGYVNHDPGHPDDVPIEVITTASSESGKAAGWSQISNKDIIVTGNIRNMTTTGAAGFSAEQEEGRPESYAERTKALFLTETYDLSLRQQLENGIRNFFGLPDKYMEEQEITINLVANERDQETATPSQVKKQEKKKPEASMEATTEAVEPSMEATTEATESTIQESTLPMEEQETASTTRKEVPAVYLAADQEGKDVETAAKPKVSVPATPSNLEEVEDLDTSGLSTYSLQAGEPFSPVGRSFSPRAGGGTYINPDNATEDSQDPVTPGPSDRLAHSFIVYDHRVSGQIHFNKRDLDLAAGENGGYSAYGDSQGDATLEGAVYGLFAADDIYGPDTQRDGDGNVTAGTGLIFDVNDLVAVATTDRNGDGSFMTITEKPHSIYNYKTGAIEYTGKGYPGNLYNQDGYVKTYPEEQPGRLYRDNVTRNGDCWIGRPLFLGNYYIRELSRSEGYELSITGKDLDVSNTDEAGRGDYGENPDSLSQPVGSAWIKQKLSHAVTFPESNPAYGNRENLFTVSVGSKDATDGYDLVIDGLLEGADFYFDNVTTKPIKVMVPDGGSWVEATTPPLYETAKGTVFKRDMDGNLITDPAAVRDVPVPYRGIGYEAKEIVPTTVTAADPGRYNAAFSVSQANLYYVKYELEQMMRQLGMETPKDGSGNYSGPAAPIYDMPVGDAYGMPEVTLTVSGVTSNASLIEKILDYYGNEKVFTYGSLQSITLTGSTATVVIACGMLPKYSLLYTKDGAGDISAVYLYKKNQVTKRYLMRKYTGSEIYSAVKLEGNLERYHFMVLPDFTVDAAGLPVDVTGYRSDLDRYLHYRDGDTLYDYWYFNGTDWVGNAPVRQKEYVVNYIEKEMTEESVNTSKITMAGSREEVADPIGSTYVYRDPASGQYILHAGSGDMDLTGVKSASFTIAIPDGSTEITKADMERIGSNNVWNYKEGDRLNHSAYLMRVSGAGAGVFTSKSFDRNTSYIKNQRLIYNGNHTMIQDGNTKEEPNRVEERIITQKIKVTKKISVNGEEEYDFNTNRIHKDSFTEGFGGYFDREADVKQPSATEIPNFRFKSYLKTNLEELYRDETGSVTWQDRNGNRVDVLDYKAAFPKEVQKLYTKVTHTGDIGKNSRDAVVANKELYSFTGGLINENQNPGYTRVLETVTEETTEGGVTKTVESYNYKKLFDAMAVANEDRWENGGAVTNTSFKPFPPMSEINTSDLARENAKASDAVRQFAITWYLEEEAKKLVKDTASGETEGKTGLDYGDALYDQALYEAIRKAQNYLLPFFTHNMDLIYAIPWDGEAGGGSDKDPTTLSADTLSPDTGAKDGYYFGLSRYLPYGTYVISEQQPKRADLQDFKNKHYEIDEPKEIDLPAVYEGGLDGAKETPEILNPYYNYDPAMTPGQLAASYQIRFNEEWSGRTGEDLRSYIIQAHDTYGDYEVYKYGLSLKRLSGADPGDPTGANHFKLTQSPFDPVKDYYHLMKDPEAQGGNPDSHYYPDDAPGAAYLPDQVEKVYHYGSVSEEKTTEDALTVMEGMNKAYEGVYAPMLVPWSVREPGNEATDVTENPDGSSNYQGFAYRKFTNTFYTTGLRLEKLDLETGENVLHDDAVFAIYSAERNDAANGDGEVRFYDRDTMIRGSREFLEAMGAENITPFGRSGTPAGNSFSGTVKAGTPICSESERIYLTDGEGNRTGEFKALSTMRDGDQAGEGAANQNTGYLETPQPLGAGAYVILEMKPTSGYQRTRPIGLEIYSDKVTYYLDGKEGNKTTATLYPEEDSRETARIYIHNTATRFEVSKIKTTDTTTLYRVGTRVEGTQLQLKNKYGAENLEFAYSHSGAYLGYGWKKGTLEYLTHRKEAGEPVEPVFENGVFTGYGTVERPLESPTDANQNVTGARLTLYDAIEVKKNGTGGDYGYDGVTVARDRNSNVERITVEKGFAGNRVIFTKEKEEAAYTYTDEIDDTGEGTWDYKTVEREATEVLHHSLSGLTFSEKQGSDTYGYDKEGNRVLLKNQTSVYALKNGRPVFELVGSRLDEITYSDRDHCFKNYDKDVVMYHLDENGLRDSLVDLTTGMAYLEEKGRVIVWPVKTAATGGGAVIARDKIHTWRIATMNADTPQEYVTGTLEGGRFVKKLNPVLNPYGLPVYYQRSPETYQKGSPVYDIDSDYVRYRYSDGLWDFNRAAYEVNRQTDLEQIGNPQDQTDDKKLYHRQGESLLMENTWLSGERFPNDPTDDRLTDGQPDMLKRVVPGIYIMEEMTPPSGYAKAFPKPVFLEETADTQNLTLENENIKVEIVKTDDADTYRLTLHSDYQEDHGITEGKGGYSHDQIVGSRLVLYRAEKIYTTDTDTYPSGYYFEKKELTPATWQVEDSTTNAMTTVTADWITDGKPKYFEGIPAGFYILEELATISGYVRSSMNLEVRETGETQSFNLKNDHTKLEIFKYVEDEKKNKLPIPNKASAGLTVYEAFSDTDGNIIYRDGLPAYDRGKVIDSWMTDDLSDYTEVTIRSNRLADRVAGVFNKKANTSGFLQDFEAAYQKDSSIKTITWLTKNGERRANLTGEKDFGSQSKEQIWTTDHGNDIRITIYKTLTGGRGGFVFEYQFNYKELSNGMKSYDTLDLVHRLDYMPLNTVKEGKPVGNYVLVETTTPEGYETADPKALTLTETGDVIRYSLRNEEKYIHVDKVSLVPDENGVLQEVQIPGVTLALYRSDGSGVFNPDPAYLVTQWVTGEDGIYTEEDPANGNPVNGYKVGDYKPHRISGVAYGDYYIAEINAPGYLVKAEPQPVTVGADQVPAYKVVNRLALGTLSILKTGEDTGEALSGARFQVTNETTGERFIMTTGEDGKAGLTGLSVAELKNDGTITPYWYQVEEITPPDYYQISMEPKRFQFDGSTNGETLTYHLDVTNEPTRIRFTKTNFSTDLLVEGAVVKIYKAKAVNGRYEKDGEAIETIKTTKDGFTIYKKLIASHAYIAEETYAPPGMILAKPLVFVLNGRGTGIQRITNDFSTITISGSGDIIESMTVSGRTATKVTLELEDTESNHVITLQGSQGDILLKKEDGIRDGGIFEITEYTTYSDGNTEVTNRETRRITLDETENFRYRGRTFLDTVLTLEDSRGIIIDSWKVTPDNQSHRIDNPVKKEPDFIRVKEKGKGHEAVEVGSLITYEISLTDAFLDEPGGQITAVLDEGLDFLRANPKGSLSEKTLTWDKADLKLKGTTAITVTAAVTQEQKQATVFTAQINGRSCTFKNPVAEKGTLTIKNNLRKLGAETTDTFNYRVILKDQRGKILPGYQVYGGSRTGRIKGEGVVTLDGDEFITFQDLPYGTSYEVTPEETYGYETDTTTQTGSTGSCLKSVVVTHRKDDETIRDVLVKNGEYILSEYTGYTDQESQLTGKYRFTINDDMVVDNIDLLDRPIEVIFSKRNITTEEELRGGLYQLIDPVTGDILHEFTKESAVKLPGDLLQPNGTYILREILAPEGYAYEQDITFRVSGSGVPETVIMHDEPTRVRIIKVNESRQFLNGSRLEILNRDKQTVIPEFTFEGKPLDITGKLEAGQEYFLHETKAPAGYLLAEDVAFTVPKEPGLIEVTMVDQRKPGEVPDTPKENEPNPKIGYIKASYENYLDGKNSINIVDGPGIFGLKLPKTGDFSQPGVWIFTLLVLMVGFLMLGNSVGRKKAAFWIVLVLFLLGGSLSVWGRQEEIEAEVQYFGVEPGQAIPKTTLTTVFDEATGKSFEREIDLLESQVIGERWVDDFSFPITFHTYDADYYQLGEHKIPYDEERPRLEGYEADLLSIIGVSPDDYQILDIQWDGDCYVAENGELQRRALATGQRKVMDYRALYGGSIALPDLPEFTPEVVNENVETTASETEPQIYQEIREEMQDKIVPLENQELQLRGQMEEGDFGKIIEVYILWTIWIGLIVLLFIIMILVYWMVQKARKNKKSLTN